MHNVNCIKNDNFAWCKDKRVKRSLFGIGARCCLVYDNKRCPYQEEYPRESKIDVRNDR